MTKANPSKFLEKLKEPDMADLRQTAIDMLENANNPIEKVTWEDRGMDDTRVIIEIRVPFEQKQRPLAGPCVLSNEVLSDY